MARAIANCKCKVCGAEFQKIKYNCWNRTDANNWVDYAEGHYETCDECKRKERQEEAKKSAEELTERLQLPELSGTEKQVEWAKSIRAKMIQRCENYINHEENNHDRHIDILSPEAIKELRQKLNTLASSHKEARFWIDERDTYPIDLMMKCSPTEPKQAEQKQAEDEKPAEEITYEEVVVPYAVYKNNCSNIKKKANSYDAENKTIVLLVRSGRQDIIDKIHSLIDAKDKEAEDDVRRTVTLPYNDVKTDKFKDRIKYKVFNSYDYRTHTSKVVLKTDEDVQFINDYYDKNKKKYERASKKRDFKDGVIDEYKIVPDVIDATKMDVTVPEELKNESA